MADENLIEIPITGEGITELRQHTQVLIDAYKRYATSIVAEDENAMYPIVAESILDLRIDTQAGCDTLESYNKLTLDDIERPSSAFGDPQSYSDIEVEGNYSISQSVYDGAKSRVDELLQGVKHSGTPRENASLGSNFKQKDNITKDPDATKGKYSQTTRKPTSDQINPNDLFNSTNKTVDQNIQTGDREKDPRTRTPQQNFTNEYSGKFMNNLGRDCIPCDLRLKTPDDVDPSQELLNVLEEMKRRFQEIIEKIKALFTNTEIAEDLCSLLNFLDFQCLPDLFSIIALLTSLLRKYSDIIPNLDGAFMQFVGPFFSPLLSGLSEILDRYLQMIMRPIDCVVNSLDTQLAKLDVERALDQSEVQNVSFHRKREGYLRRKMEQLEERRSFLTNLKEDPNSTTTGSSAPPTKIGGEPRSSQSNILRDEIDSDPTSARGSSTEITLPFGVTVDEELDSIDTDLQDTRGQYDREYGPRGANNINELIRESQNPRPSVFGGSLGQGETNVGNARGSLRDARQGISSSLYELRNQILNGKRMVNDTLRLMRDELRRLIFGRAATQEELLEGARNIQRTARLIGIVNTLIKLGKTGKLCENSNGNPSIALGAFLTANRGTETNRNFYNVYTGTNDSGEESLLIAPSDAVLELVGEDNQVTQIGDLNEIDKLNRSGLPKDLGNIANKKVVATSSDLGIQVPVALIAFDLCRNADFSNEPDVDRIKQWAQDTGIS